jgi:IPT/TIG domain
MRRALFASGSAIAIGVGAACLPGSGPPLLDRPDASPANGPSLGDDAAAQRHDVDLGDPFGIDGLVPSHGPWTGGTRAKLSGRGFSSKLRVFIGATELDPSAVLASDPSRAAVITPPGTPGPVDVKVRDDASAQERVLSAGFFYDAFVVVPDTGATTGGTRILLQGSGTHFGAGDSVTVGGKPCAEVAVDDATHLRCLTPPGAPGARDVTVTDPNGAVLQARDAFTYGDSPDGYRGGLSGGALHGALKVLAFDAYVGTPIAGAFAIAGDDIAKAVVGKTNDAGVAALSDPKLDGTVTVTVAGRCHHPFTFVDVPVDTVTVYLAPVLDPACGDGDPPSSGSSGSKNGGEIDGELVWKGGIEFARASWTNVPAPARPSERQAAYVFSASGSPLERFGLPPAGSAVTPTSQGIHGYGYAIGAYPGNQTIYAVAGIEDRSLNPPLFIAYAMGVARGVDVQPGVRTVDVDIAMTTLLDHRVRVSPLPPPSTGRGPDRLVAQVAVTLGATNFAVFPAGYQQSLLPLGGDLAFTGVPALDGALGGESYVLGMTAATGARLGTPASIVSRIRTTDSSGIVTVTGFLPPPILAQPGTGPWSGTKVSFTGGGTYDVSLVLIESGGGLVGWTVVAPGGNTSFSLPDLRALPGPDYVGLVPGEIRTTIYDARLDAFTYGKLRTGQLGTGSWSAYAFDGATGSY